MKFLSLNLIAFGPFTQTVLNFYPPEKGLHLIYGPNEAGKSSALRALRCVLYGIPERSIDDFVHPYSKMRIGATLINHTGHQIGFVRRKGRSGTLRDVDDAEPLNEGILSEFLSGVDETLFSTLFGIDHAVLVKGGEEIITGVGDIGQILFSAGSGISDFRKIQSDIQAEAEKLFKPGGKTPLINESIATLKNTQKTLRDTQLSGSNWECHDRNLHDALSEKTAIENDLDDLIRSKNRLQRIQHALPSIGRRKDCLTDLIHYQNVILLPENFSERRHNLITRLHVSESESRQTEAALSEIMQSIAEIQIPENLLIHASQIELFHKKLGEFMKDSLDRPRLAGFYSSHLSDAMSILAAIRPDLTLDQADSLKLKKTDMLAVQELGSTYENLVGQRQALNTEISRCTINLEQIQKTIADAPKLPELLELQALFESIQSSGDIALQIQSLENEIRKTESLTSTSLSRLKPFQGSLELMAQTPVPMAETIDRFDDEIKTHTDRMKQLSTQQNEYTQLLAGIQKQLNQIRLEQEPPTEADLIAVRSERNRMWLTIRKMDWTPKSNVLEDYEHQVRNADAISDRLRYEADRVAQKAGLLSDQELHTNRLNQCCIKIETVNTQLENLVTAWKNLWKPLGFIPLSPKEMRSWLQCYNDLLNRAEMLRELKSRRDNLCHQQTIYSNQLKIALSYQGHAQPDGLSLNTLLETARQLIKHAEAHRITLEKLHAEMKTRQTGLREAQMRSEGVEKQLCEWQNRWAEAIRPIGLEPSASTAQAMGVLDDLKSLVNKLKEAEGFHKRIEGIDRDTREYTDMVTTFITRESPDLSSHSLEGMVTALNNRLNQAREAKARRQSLEKQQRHEENTLKRVRHTLLEIQTQIHTLCEEARCNSLHELADAEQRSERRRVLEMERDRLDAEISRFSAGQGLEMFIEDALSIDSDLIAFQLQDMTERINEMGSRKSELDQVIGQERNELGRMNGNSVAAALAQDSQGLLARIQSLAERFIRLKLASGMLSQAVERYREKHQGPVLSRSAELFSQMTLGKFRGLRLEYTEKGDGFLVGVRHDGDMVNVHGMSEGTADQLYLAVRIAGLEAYLSGSKPMPFIIDDILIKFDDARAIETLKLLAELSEKTQVIFFTHHSHLIDLAKQHVDSRYWTQHII